MRGFVFLAVASLAFASALAPLYTQKNRVDGSYIGIFNVDAPSLLTLSEVSEWLASQAISGKVTNVYHLKTDSLETSFRGFAGRFEQDALQKLLENKFMKYVEEDMEVHVDPIFENNGTVGTPTSIWGLDRTDQHCLPLNNDFSPCSGVPDTSNCQGTSSVVWIVDTGVRVTHGEFGGRAVASVDFATGDTKPYNGDCNGHGTHVAGSCCGNTCGVCPKCLIRSVRVLNCQGSGTNANVIFGFDFVGNNMVSGKRNIMSASIGGGLSTSTNNAVESLISKGTICVVAAGNDNANACNYSPASATNAITVGATTSTDARSSFSNYGTCVKVFAPGTSIYSAWYTSDTATNTISGTSMATPYVSGGLAIAPGTVTPSSAKTLVSSYSTANVVSSPGTGSPNLLLYVKWNDGTSRTC